MILFWELRAHLNVLMVRSECHPAAGLITPETNVLIEGVVFGASYY